MINRTIHCSCLQAYLILVCVALFNSAEAQSTYGQWPNFNMVHPVSNQSPPFYYQAKGYFEMATVLDYSFDYYDGFMFFGQGILCNPDSCTNYSRCYSAKCNASGELYWWNRYDSKEGDSANFWYSDVTIPWGGNIVIDHKGRMKSLFSVSTGYGYSSAPYTRDYLVTIDDWGEMSEKILVDSSYDTYGFSALLEDYIDSTYVMSGAFLDSVDYVQGNDSRGFLMKVDSLGHLLWRQVYPGTSKTYTINKAQDGGFWVCAGTHLPPACSNWPSNWTWEEGIALFKTDAMGNVTGRVDYSSPYYEGPFRMREISPGRVVIYGKYGHECVENLQSESIYKGDFIRRVAVQQPDGTLLWEGEFQHFLPSYYCNVAGLASVDDGEVLVTNLYGSPLLGQGDVYSYKSCFYKFDVQGDSLWRRFYTYYDPGTPRIYTLYDAQKTPDGSIVACGGIKASQNATDIFLDKPWIIKVDSMGCLEPGCQYVGIEEQNTNLTEAMSIYPNPIKQVATIQFNLPPGFREAQSELVVIDLQGRELKRHVLSPSAFIAPVELDFSGVPSGVYLVHWINGDKWFDSVKVVKE